MLMSEAAGPQGVPVALVVLFDGTQPATVGENVARVMNITQRVAITAVPDSMRVGNNQRERGRERLAHHHRQIAAPAGGGHRQDQDGSRSRRAGGTGERANANPPVERPDKPESRL